MADEEWKDRGACRGKAPRRRGDPDPFFPEGRRQAHHEQREALDCCSICPVKIDCLRYAITTRQQYGHWGGHTERQIRHLLDTPPLPRSAS